MEGNMEVKNSVEAYLFCFPLSIEKKMTTVSEIKCFQLIWLKCCYEHTFSNVYITKRDRDRIMLSRLNYVRGLEALEQLKIISVNRKSGRCNLITVNTEMIDKKSQDSVLKRA